MGWLDRYIRGIIHNPKGAGEPINKKKLKEELGEELFKKRKKLIKSQSAKDYFNKLPEEKKMILEEMPIRES